MGAHASKRHGSGTVACVGTAARKSTTGRSLGTAEGAWGAMCVWGVGRAAEGGEGYALCARGGGTQRPSGCVAGGQQAFCDSKGLTLQAGV